MVYPFRITSSTGVHHMNQTVRNHISRWGSCFHDHGPGMHLVPAVGRVLPDIYKSPFSFRMEAWTIGTCGELLKPSNYACQNGCHFMHPLNIPNSRNKNIQRGMIHWWGYLRLSVHPLLWKVVDICSPQDSTGTSWSREMHPHIHIGDHMCTLSWCTTAQVFDRLSAAWWPMKGIDVDKANKLLAHKSNRVNIKVLNSGKGMCWIQGMPGIPKRAKASISNPTSSNHNTQLVYAQNPVPYGQWLLRYMGFLRSQLCGTLSINHVQVLLDMSHICII